MVAAGIQELEYLSQVHRVVGGASPRLRVGTKPRKTRCKETQKAGFLQRRTTSLAMYAEFLLGAALIIHRSADSISDSHRVPQGTACMTAMTPSSPLEKSRRPLNDKGRLSEST